jgi:hypothetical protein
VAAIINNMSENALPTTPAMTVYINNVTYDRDRVQDPTFVGKMNIRQRYYNEDTQEFSNRIVSNAMSEVSEALQSSFERISENFKSKSQFNTCVCSFMFAI